MHNSTIFNIEIPLATIGLLTSNLRRHDSLALAASNVWEIVSLERSAHCKIVVTLVTHLDSLSNHTSIHWVLARIVYKHAPILIIVTSVWGENNAKWFQRKTTKSKNRSVDLQLVYAMEYFSLVHHNNSISILFVLI